MATAAHTAIAAPGADSRRRSGLAGGWLRGPTPLRRRLVGLVSGGRVAGAVVLILIVGLRVEDWRPLELVRLEVFDTFQRVVPRPLSSGKVAVVDVDEASLDRFGQWPWSRRLIGDLVVRLEDAGAQAIGFDFLFAEPDRLSPPAFGMHTPDLPDVMRAILLSLPDTDEALAAVLASSPVVLGRAMAHDRIGSGLPGGDRSAPMATVGGDPAPFLFSYPTLLTNLGVLEHAASGLGTFTLTPEPDGMVRRVPTLLRVGDRVHPSLAVEMLRVARGEALFRVHTNPQGAGIQAVGIGDLMVPTDSAGRVWLRYAASDPDLYLSAGDLLDGGVDPAALAGKLVLIGSSATGLRDLRVTPLSESIAGVEIHAQMIDAILAGDVLVRPPYALGIELTLALLGGGLLLYLVPGMGARAGLAALVGVLAVAWALSLYGFHAWSQLIDATLPTIAAVAIFALLAYANYTRAERKRREIRSAFGQYLSPSLVQQLEEHPDRLRLGGEVRELTFVFTDLAGFTAMVERMDPEQLVSVLNGYLDGMCEIVMRHGGTIDKIVGDAVHTMFGAPVPQADHATRALRCAVELDRFAENFRSRLAGQGLAFGITRIGVNTGSVVVGNFGGTRRLDYTAHGDAINMAARLESSNKLLGTRICVARSTAQQSDAVPLRPLGTLQIRGQSEAVEVFEPIDPEMSHRAAYECAFAQLRAGDALARSAFEALAQCAPDDPVVALHRKRIADGQLNVELGMQRA